MIVWLLCSAFLLLGFALGVYASYPRKKQGMVVDPALTFEQAHDKAAKAIKGFRPEPTRLTDVDK